MNRPKGLLGIDIDGTLINDHGHITEEVLSALARAAGEGWEIVPASGRSWLGAKPVVEQLSFVRYAVVSNGACILDVRSESLLHLRTLAPGLADRVIRAAYDQNVIPAVYSADILRQKIFYSERNCAEGDFFRYLIDDIRVEKVADVLAHTGNVLQVGAVSGREAIFRMRDALDDLDAAVVAMPFVDDTWLMQVVDREARKHLALRRVAAMLDIPAGRRVAVGDNFNDAGMIADADIGVAMGNAPEEIKALAAVVVASNNDHGLAEVVDTVILSGAFFS